MTDSDLASSQHLVEVSWSSLSSSALNGLLQEFVTRDGTDYGSHEASLEDKVRQARRALEQGEVLIVVDLNLETTQLVDADEFKKMQQS